jgi:hypothetical protein
MKIEWNKVTWYSKCLALALIIVLPFLGFYFGEKYGEIKGFFNGYDVSVQVPQGAAAAAGSDYYSNVAAWQTDQRDDAGFSIAYPIDFPMDDNSSVTPSDDWSMNAFGTTGIKVLELDIPKAFEPQTNFDDAKLTIGRSSNDVAVRECLSPSTEGPTTAVGTTTVNGTVFSVMTSSDAGAGNYYETTSYRALHGGQCYAVEYTIHSSQIANYPASYGLHPYDDAKVASVLQKIAGTFQFK